MGAIVPFGTTALGTGDVTSSRVAVVSFETIAFP
jgi:hypothetical protein